MPAPSKQTPRDSLEHMTKTGAAALLSLAAAASSGCGYSEADMQLLRDRVELQRRLLDACEQQSRACSARLRCSESPK